MGDFPFVSKMALSGAPLPEIEQAANAVFNALHAAEAKAPAAQPGQDVETAVFVDMLDRAALQYAKARSGASGDAYLDGYGFLQAAKERSGKVLENLSASRPETAKAARDALDVLAKTYPAIEMPADSGVDPGTVLAATSRLRLTL